MSWIYLIVSGLLEAVWAGALSASRAFTRPVPSIVFFVALLLSMGGLALALRGIPVGTGYATWVGIGAAGTATYGIAVLGEPAGAARIVSLLLIVAGVIGLTLFTPN